MSTAEGGPPTADRSWTPLYVAVGGFLAVSVLLLLLGRLALDAQLGLARQEFEPGAGWIGQWVRWDANWYFHIARDGYGFRSGGQDAAAFWPAYPMAIRALSALTDDEYDAGLLITWTCGLAYLAMVGVWCRGRLAGPAAVASVVTVLLLPYGWYLHWSVYSDALFAACALGAFLLLERDMPLAAGLLGAVAAADRPVGLAVFAGLALLTAERRDALVPVLAPRGSGRLRRAAAWLRVPRSVRWRRLRPRDAWVLVSMAGAVAYAVYLWRTRGDPFAFAAAQEGWDQAPGPRSWFKVAVVDRLRAGVVDRETVGMLFQGVLALGAIACLPRVVRRFGWGYGAFCAVVVIVPTVASKDFHGLGRYLLPAFPIAAVVGEWLAARPLPVRLAVWGASASVAAFWAYSYARGAYVA